MMDGSLVGAGAPDAAEDTRETTLFTLDRLVEHARQLGASDVVDRRGQVRSRPVLTRLDEAAARLQAVYRALSAAADDQRLPSEDWIRDNFHVVADQVRQVRTDLPPRYYQELPRLANGPYAGYPRVYGLASQLVAHTDNRVDAELLTSFVSAYQEGHPLQIGEVWAIPIMLRLALVERLRGLADAVVAARADRLRAQELAARLELQAARRGRWRWKSGVELPETLTPAFVVELLRRLRDRPLSVTPAWSQLLEPLEAAGGPDAMIRSEAQIEASMQVSIGNAVSSMRTLSALDWPTFVERVSHLEQILRGDPAGAYARMDFATRDRYRQSVEQLARRSEFSEVEVARRACALAEHARRLGPQAERRHHVGYYLISRGRFDLEADLHYQPRARERVARFVFRHPAIGYLGSIGLLTLLGTASLVLHADRHGAVWPMLLLTALVVAIPISDLAINLVNRLVTSFVPPRRLPKLDYREGIPPEHRTIVVVPALIGSARRAVELAEHLEVRYLANADPHLHFALLGDFHDADAECLDDDDEVVEAATTAILALNARHGADRFLYLHRRRQFNASERVWMGWERKRGKIEEFNRLVLGRDGTSFDVQVGELRVIAQCRYVITLDADTDLPPDSARRMVGALAHPLNQPRFDPRAGVVTEGYGILQPRVEISLPSASRSWFARVMSGHVGWDPYTTAASDVYQDLFHEGSYVGKGIYDPRAFEAALSGRVGDNTLLSHDLFEGFFARAGLAADIHLVDDFPSHYLTWATRHHRWVRGDWQIAGWLGRRVVDGTGRRAPNVLPVLARWKILDNLRRSLLPPALVLLLALGWTVLPGSAFTWTTLSILVMAYPAYFRLGESLGSRVRGVPLREHLRNERAELVSSLRQSFVTITFLAHQAWLMLDAIGRTLWRMTISRRRLLEWESASDATRRTRTDASSVWKRLWVSPVLALALTALVGATNPRRLPAALPLLLCWTVAPAVAFRTGRLRQREPVVIDDRVRRRLRGVARQTWHFFETFATAEHHWLIPDNYQADRRDPVAARTSPTNIGLQLLSTVAARDLGYLTVSDAVDRIERVVDTLASLPKYRGHLYNWIDTRTLAPLHPLYVSTVDSGNLIGSLLITREALAELRERTPLVDGNTLDALGDELGLVEQHARDWLATSSGSPAGADRFLRELDVMRQRLTARPRALSGWLWLFQDLSDRLTTLDVLLHEIEDDSDVLGPLSEARDALRALATGLDGRRLELRQLVPLGTAPRGADEVPTLAALAADADAVAAAAPQDQAGRAALQGSAALVTGLIARLERIERQLDLLVQDTDLAFLFDRSRRLFSIGFNVSDGRLDQSHYDSLASEARLASFLAIALGQVPQEHWFRLGRTHAPAASGRVLLSWSASMFEYLMPLLFLRHDPATLLHDTCEAVVREQMDYARRHDVPWGISESAYNTRDLEGNYQYKAFGVPGLGLKRGLGDDLVVAPYASLLAAMLRPAAVVDNLDALDAEGLWSKYGYYDAIDYTGARLPAGASSAVVRTVMAHHQGMVMVALDNCLNGQAMPQRLHRDPRVQAVELLLHERVPSLVPLAAPPSEQVSDIRTPRTAPPPVGRRYTTPHTAGPRAHFLSHGTYAVMVTTAGGGYSTCRGLAMTRWREDRTVDGWGQFCYVRDLASGAVWSTTFQPTRVEPDDYEVAFGPDRAIIRRRDGTLDTHTEIAVSPEDEVELRRVSLINRGTAERELDLTSYAEVVLAPEAADAAHPAFGSLFVETTLLPERDAILCARRPRGDEPRRYLFHVLASRGRVGGATEFETDRARFIGRLGGLDSPLAMASRERLSGTHGAVLDPIVSLRQRVRLPPGATARVSFVTGYADTEEQARQLIEKYHDRQAVSRGLALAGGHSLAEMRHLNLDDRQVNVIQRLASRLRFAETRLRGVDALQRNRQSRDALWKHGISGDLPLLLVVIDQQGDHGLVRDTLKAHEYCRLKGFVFDLVILNQFGEGYRQDVQEHISALIETSPVAAWRDRPGGVFLRRSDSLSADDSLTLRAIARAVLTSSNGSLAHQLEMPGGLIGAAESTAAPAWKADGPPVPAPEPRLPADLILAHDLGGFTPDGREYVIRVGSQAPPAPWSNVLANPGFGCLVTEAGPRCTWTGNSQSRRLTTWANDPVTDPATEAVFLYDRVADRAWSLSPSPRPSGAGYLVRHTQGSTSWEHGSEQWLTTLSVTVPADAPVKILHLRVHNAARSTRTATLTWYAELVLGDTRLRTATTIVTRQDAATGMLLADNVASELFGPGVVFMDTSEARRVVSGDRAAFIGRNRTLARARGIGGMQAGRTGAALDPCGVVQVDVTLGSGETRDVIFLMGHAPDADQARQLALTFRDPVAALAAREAALARWDDRLGRLTLRTPDPTLDVMLNRWLPYQTLACRIWGRTAFYQSSGAFGFRDQLQDVLALLTSEPGIGRAQLLRAASRQFVEGDVQHWWHEPGGQGVRTRFSDDRWWLVFAALHYVEVTGDAAVFDEVVPFLEARRLAAHEHELYQPAFPSPESGTLFEHCARAVDISLEAGAHGLPLIGTGDWNDGLSQVGPLGRGESVWLAWFQLAVLPRFAALADERGQPERVRRYRNRIMTLEMAADAAWDGAWYRRAYFDDGTPLGSVTNSECRIDAIAQAWAVLSGRAEPSRAQTAMASTDRWLVDREAGIIRLLTPPFDRMTPSPGYIRGYVPGVRENGGQYTHAALWLIQAWAMLGDGTKAGELLAMINPARKASTTAGVSRYRVEPYVVAADVYSVEPHAGRGGWTWYTGSAAWMYRVAVETLLGIRVEDGTALRVEPCIPAAWDRFEATLRRDGGTTYVVTVENPHRGMRGVELLEVDGTRIEGTRVDLADDGGQHHVRVVIAAGAQQPSRPARR